MGGDSRPHDLSLVRASDLSAWAYCKRAWWLATVKGVQHQDPLQLERGRTSHAEHGRNMQKAARLQHLGLLAAGVALLLLVAALAVGILT
jgi:hypothetical protein